MKKTITYVAVAALLISSGGIGVHTVQAESISDIQNKLSDLEKKQQELDKKDGALNSDKSKTQKKIDENLDKQDSVKNEMASIDEKLANTKSKISTKENEINETNEEINRLEQQIKDLEKQIKKLKEEIKELQESIKKREAILKDRLRAIQKNGGQMKYMEVILGSRSFSDFISRSSAVNTIMDQDRSIMDQLAADKKAMEQMKKDVEKKKTKIEDNKQEVEAKKASLEGQKKELLSLKGELDSQMAEKEKLQQKLEKEHAILENHKMSIAEEQEIIRSQEAAVKKALELAKKEKEELEQLSDNKNNNSGGGTVTKPSGNGAFTWPVSGYITDHFGTRGGTHKGLDIGNATAKAGGNVPIFSVASGVVTKAYYSQSYGNVVFITHIVNGVQYESVYAHMKYTPMVRTLQTVSKGQQIGIMGNTGDSFGTHLHFELHNPSWNMSKSNAVNPLSYLN